MNVNPSTDKSQKADVPSVEVEELRAIKANQDMAEQFESTREVRDVLDAAEVNRSQS